MRLADLELAVQAHLLAGDALPPALAAAVAPPAHERWSIYAGAYRARLVEALGATYPALRARAGADGFEALAQEFVAATPSVHRSIRDYGAELADVLARRASDAEGDLRAELARFEWALAAAFDAAAADPVRVETLAALPAADWPELRLAPVPSVRRLATRTNAVSAWQALHPEADGTVPVPEARRDDGPPQQWLIARRGLTTEFRSLPAEEAAALDRLLGGATFAEVCAALDGEDAAVRVAGWLKGWVLAEVLTRV